MGILDDVKATRKGRPARSKATTPAADEAPRTLAVRTLAGVKARPVRWLIPRTIPAGKVIMLAGVGGMGKSTLTRHLISRLTSGQPFFGMTAGPPCDVLLASVEDSQEDTIVPHLLAEGADLARVRVVEGVYKADWKPGERAAPFTLLDLESVRAEVESSPGARLLVIDPIMSFVGRSGANENSSGEVRRLIDPLIDLADRTGLAVLLVGHLNKATNVAAVNRIVGTGAFRDVCRVVYAMGTDPNDRERRVVALIKENVPGIDRRSLAFTRVPLAPAEAEAVLAAPEFADLDRDDRAEMTDQLARVEAAAGRVDITADQALGTGQKAGDQAPKAERTTCTEWITKRIGSTYAWPDDQIEREAVDAGFSIWTYRKAKGFIPGLMSRPVGYQGKFRIGIGDVHRMPLSEEKITSEATETTEAGGQSRQPQQSRNGKVDADGGPGWPADAPQ